MAETSTSTTIRVIDAAKRLNMTIADAIRLVYDRTLVPVPKPTGGRWLHVTTESVEAVAAARASG